MKHQALTVRKPCQHLSELLCEVAQFYPVIVYLFVYFHLPRISLVWLLIQTSFFETVLLCAPNWLSA